MRTVMVLAIFLLALGGCRSNTESTAEQKTVESETSRPNILVIMADDLGYTDPGFMGGEISTTNLDALADNGVIMSSFYAAPTCSPTRAMLLSGTDSHLAGLGTMKEAVAPNQRGQAGYEGYLNHRVVSLPTLLKDAGYHTFMSGKWHLGDKEDQSPRARGFERSFALMPGAGSHFSLDAGPRRSPDESYREDGQYVKTLPDDFYSTHFYTRKMIDYIESREDDRPFFGYLAFSAPHWPLQVPEEDRDLYQGVYDQGYDVLRDKRFERAKALGLIPDDLPLPRDYSPFPSWKSLSGEQQQYEARKMEIYAAMVDIVDRNIGLLVSHLEAVGELDNTVIIFLSDNGAEGSPLKVMMPEQWLARFDNSLDNLGAENSYVGYGSAWAQVSMAPFRFWKMHATEGGIRVPALFWAGKEVSKTEGMSAGVNPAVATVMDLAPTIYELAGTAHPGTHYQGREVLPLRGQSLLPLVTGQVDSVHGDKPLGGELFNGRSLRKGDWKVVWDIAPGLRGPGGPWQLFNIVEDPSESHDLAEAEPEKLRELIGEWENYAKETGVILPDFSQR